MTRALGVSRIYMQTPTRYTLRPPSAHQFVSIPVAKKNRLGSTTATVRRRNKAHIAWLKQEMNDIDEGLRQILLSSPQLREKDDILRSVPWWASRSPSLCYRSCRSWAR